MIDGLAVGLDMINRHCGTKKYKKRVFLITDGEKKTNSTKAELANLIQKMNATDVRLNVITLDFCNELAQEDDSDEEESNQL